MNQEEQTQQFPELPSDVLLLIFDRLNFRSRLAASLVCHRWNQLAFAANFLNKLSITLTIQSIEQLNEAIVYLQRSNRQYRSMRLIFQGCRQHNLDAVLDVLRPMHTLNTLEMVFYFYCFRENLNILLKEVLCSCPSLTSTSFEIRGQLMSWSWTDSLPPMRSSNTVIDLDNDSQILPSLTSLTITRNSSTFNTKFYETPYVAFYAPPEPEVVPNLRHLTMSCETHAQLYLFSHLSNQLETVSVVSFDAYGYLIEPFLKLNLPQVKYLKLGLISLPHFRELIAFILTLRRIETLQLDEVLIDSEVIDAIIENCLELRQLGLHMESLNAGCLKRIDRLTKLTRLILNGKKSTKIETYDDYLRGCGGQLTNLQSLALQSFKFSSNEFILNQAKLISNLKEFQMHECRANHNIIGPIFNHCQKLTKLEFVKVSHGGAWPIWPPNLTTARFINCSWLTGDHITNLVKHCPKLRHLNIYGCGTSNDMLQKIAVIVPPGCFVERTYTVLPLTRS